MSQDKRNKSFIVFIFKALLCLIIGAMLYIFKKKQEKNQTKFKIREIKDTYNDLGERFKVTFIPSEENDHRPYALRPKNLAKYLVLIIAVKVIIVSLLFILYPSPAFLVEEITSQIVENINFSRKDKGIHYLEINEILTRAAQNKAQDMLDNSYFGHVSPLGTKPWDFIDRNSYRYMAAGENLAMGFTNADSAHRALMGSPSHQKIILNNRYNEIGVAVAYGKIDGEESTLLVEFFGSTESKSKFLARIENQEPKEEPIPYFSQLAPEDSQNNKVLGEVVELEQPQRELEDSSAVVVVSEETSKIKNWINRVVGLGDKFLYFFLIYLSISLVINTVIHWRIQKASIIIPSLVVIIITLLTLSSKLHFFEELIHKAISLG